MKIFSRLLLTLKTWVKNPFFWSFIACFLYWAYLFFTSHMNISCDAINYEATGKLLQEQGWIAYFKTGPHREPFYPFLISLAMVLGKYFSISYQPIIVIFQLTFLLLTQLLTLFVLKLLKIKNSITALTLLYLGISPAILNSALSLFSEIAIYPFILSIVLITYYSWLAFNKSRTQTIILAIISGMLFCATTLNKAIFEMIIPGFIILMFLLSLLTRRQKFILNCLLYLLITAAVFHSSIFAYKLTNKNFNGNFVITERGDLKLYGTAVRRTEPLTKEHLLIALAYVPGEGFCQSIFGNEKCSYWGFEEIDLIGFNKVAELKNKGLKPEQVNKFTIKLAIKQVLSNPWQYSLFYFLEASKMFFWESTKIGFVTYPTIIDKIFDWKPLKNVLRFTVFVLTLAALISVVIYLWKRRKKLLNMDALPQERTEIILLSSVFIIFLFIGIHSLFDTVTRYILPITPLYLITIAFCSQRVINKKTATRINASF